MLNREQKESCSIVPALLPGYAVDTEPGSKSGTPLSRRPGATAVYLVVLDSIIDSPGCGGSSPSRIRGACGDARKGVTYRDRSLGEGDQAADRNSRLRILVRSSTRFILGISSRSIAV